MCQFYVCLCVYVRMYLDPNLIDLYSFYLFSIHRKRIKILQRNGSSHEY